MRADPEGGTKCDRPGPAAGEAAHHGQRQRGHQAVRVGTWDAGGQPLPAQHFGDVIEVDRDAGNQRRRQEGQRRSSGPDQREQREQEKHRRREVGRLVDGRKLGRGRGARDDVPEQVKPEDEGDQRDGQPPGRTG